MSKTNKGGLVGSIQHMDIAKRITLLYSGIFSLSLLFISVFMALNISSLQQAEMRKQLQDTVFDIQNYLESVEKLSEEALGELLQDKYVEASVFSFTENEVYNSYTGEAPPFIFRPEMGKNRGQNGEDADLSKDSPMLKENDLYQKGYQINVSRENKGGSMEYILENETDQQFMLITNHFHTEQGAYRIQAFKMFDDGGYIVRNFLMKMLAVDILGICCAFLIGRYISRRMLKPVEAIRTAAERISIEDLSQRISTEGPDDEMKELTITFNSMIDRLDTAFQRQNQFISDASHELRTPIAVIQGYANLINRWGKSDPEVLQESIDSILTETDHMSALIRQLLFLAKSDQSKLHVQKAKVSLNEIAGELVREMTMLQEGRTVTFTEEAEVELFADYDLIKQLLWIHGENALKYSREKIEVKVWKDQEYGYVSVKDYGVGIAVEDLPKIFDRFYRVDKSRNKEISGTGLGLAIARRIVDSHDGDILVESKVGEGTVFTDKFPLLAPEMKPTSKMKQKKEI